MTLGEDLASVVGAAHVITDPAVRAGYERDWTRRFGGSAAAVVRPGCTAEVAGVLDVCAGRATPVVTQGGNTGLVGGGVPPASGRSCVLLSTTRLTYLGPVDTVAAQVTAGAGVSLAALQAHAATAGLCFAVDLAARDSATVGGMIATNAGGLHVLRYGPMRAQVVGLEAALAGGRVLSRMDGLLKDSTGYDLSQLLVGSEGTLGVVTAARLRLVPEQPERATCLLGLEGTSAALHLLPRLRRAEGIEAAEIFYEDGLELVCSHAGLPRPLPRAWPAYLLVECASARDPAGSLYEALAAADLPEDATAVACDPAGRARLWAYRERHTEAVSSLGVPHKLDVSLPLDRLAAFEAELRKVVGRAAPGAKLVLFGHVGDGNLHVNVVGPADGDDAVDEAVLRLATGMGGSISAEHGVGRAKAPWVHLSRSADELAAMAAIKAALDPGGLLNPGVLLPARGPA